MQLVDLERLVIANSGQSFKGEDFRQMCGPIVYMFCLEGRPLYIGSSKDGLSRPGGRNHRQHLTSRRLCDEVKIWACPTVDAARKLERLLIAKTQPAHNKQCKMNHLATSLGMTNARAWSYRLNT